MLVQPGKIAGESISYIHSSYEPQQHPRTLQGPAGGSLTGPVTSPLICFRSSNSKSRPSRKESKCIRPWPVVREGSGVTVAVMRIMRCNALSSKTDFFVSPFATGMDWALFLFYLLTVGYYSTQIILRSMWCLGQCESGSASRLFAVLLGPWKGNKTVWGQQIGVYSLQIANRVSMVCCTRLLLENEQMIC